MKTPRVIVITGASSGIGAALARHYAKSGISLYLTGRSEERLQEVAAACTQSGAYVQVKAIDVTDAKALADWLLEVDSATPVDLLVANAGISGGSGGGSVHGEEPDQVRRILRINLDGVINSVTPLIPRMSQRRRGQIAIMSSLAGLRGLPSAPAYSTSKMAVRAYGESLRGMLARYGIGVSVIMPGYIRTPLTAKNPFPMPFLMEPEKAASIIARGLARNKSRIAFPLPMYLPMVLLGMLPMCLTDPIFARLPAKPAVAE